jgi:hypothetical protein
MLLSVPLEAVECPRVQVDVTITERQLAGAGHQLDRTLVVIVKLFWIRREPPIEKIVANACEVANQRRGRGVRAEGRLLYC